VFHYIDGADRTLFTLDNHEPAPFLPEQVKQITTGGVTLVLDVPRVADGAAALEKMVQIARELAAGLGGRLVDDNRVPLTEGSMQAIRQQLASIHEAMTARGTPPGSERALRLFS
jgi:FtsZ-interacting cell division protein ZipA